MQVNPFIMKKIIAIFLFLSMIAVLFSSCERNCYCKNLETGEEGIYYGAYSKKECGDVEEYYNDLYNDHIYECTYK